VRYREQEAALGAFTKIIDNAKAYNADAQIEGVMVEQQAEPGLELIIGGRTDPAFGKVITFAWRYNGRAHERRDAPDPSGFRRGDPADDHKINAYPSSQDTAARTRDEEGLVKIIANVCRFFDENENIVEFDINPLRLYESGACAVDARVIVTDTVTRREAKERVPVPIEYFNPRSIAVIGASQDSSKMGYAVCTTCSTSRASSTRSITSVPRSRGSRHIPTFLRFRRRSTWQSSPSRQSMCRCRRGVRGKACADGYHRYCRFQGDGT